MEGGKSTQLDVGPAWYIAPEDRMHSETQSDLLRETPLSRARNGQSDQPKPCQSSILGKEEQEKHEAGKPTVLQSVTFGHVAAALKCFAPVSYKTPLHTHVAACIRLLQLAHACAACIEPARPHPTRSYAIVELYMDGEER